MTASTRRMMTRRTTKTISRGKMARRPAMWVGRETCHIPVLFLGLGVVDRQRGKAMEAVGLIKAHRAVSSMFRFLTPRTNAGYHGAPSSCSPS